MHTTMRQFRDRATKYGLERAECTDCGRMNDPSAELCYHCGGDAFEDVTLSRRGEVKTYVVQHILPETFDTPLPIAIVETPEGGKVLGMFTEVDDPHAIEMGEQVTIELKRFDRQDGQVLYEPKFRREGGETA
ncbi:Zn-ribbon domain-containing OB-fold protein [Halorientalis halophila]|uniref:Zn-ribbon domain-containing OB-fold protein n=1 Tax=Halorientalis halophila TaxID=3108499 RepID=UPI0030091D92